MSMIRWWCVLVASWAGIAIAQRVAWGVLVEDDGESVGALAAGASLRAAGTVGALVALTGPGVRRRALLDLELAGWEVVVSGRGVGSRFERAVELASKLRFDKVVIVETYTIALENVDELFACPGTCAAHDVSLDAPFPAPIVVTPGKTATLDHLSRCDFFDPLDGGSNASKCHRLPTRYSAFGLWLLLNADRDDPTRLVRYANPPSSAWLARRRARLAHLALGPARPWHWWAASLLPLASRWRRARDLALETISLDTAHERSLLETRASENFALSRACVLPWVLLVPVLLHLPRRRRLNSPCLDVLVGHVALAASIAIAFFAADGSTTFHTFFRPSAQLLHKRSPAAGASVFYSTTIAALVLFLCVYHAPTLRVRPPLDFIAVLLCLLIPTIAPGLIKRILGKGHAEPANLVESAAPFAAASALVAVFSTLAFLRLGEACRRTAR